MAILWRRAPSTDQPLRNVRSTAAGTTMDLSTFVHWSIKTKTSSLRHYYDASIGQPESGVLAGIKCPIIMTLVTVCGIDPLSRKLRKPLRDRSHEANNFRSRFALLSIRLIKSRLRFGLIGIIRGVFNL